MTPWDVLALNIVLSLKIVAQTALCATQLRKELPTGLISLMEQMYTLNGGRLLGLMRRVWRGEKTVEERPNPEVTMPST